MKQYNYPTTILYGEGALEEAAKRISEKFNKPLIVTDKVLVELGLVKKLSDWFDQFNLPYSVFSDVHTNPLEEDVNLGAEAFLNSQCDCLIGFGGGSPMDVAKGIAVRASQEGPMAQFDDAKGGDALMDGDKIPPNIAIPTTAGTGSEVGRAGVITVEETGLKTIIFHPKLLPELAVLAPELTLGLPKSVTAATGIDAFTHNLEAYFAPGFHPMADGIALEGMKLVLQNLRECFDNGENYEARGRMLMAASMGATAFQKGLGMIHAIAHPLSSECGLHHGLANALMLPYCVEFLEKQDLNSDQKMRIENVKSLFKECGLEVKESLAETCKVYFESFDISFGLRHHGVTEDKITPLSEKAFLDVSHKTNMVQVDTQILKEAIERAF
jgi:4-hydroxybutyrate dehydrogenase